MRISDWSSDVCSSDLTEAKSGGYSTFAARIKWGDKLEIVNMTQRWGERFLHFRDDDRAISRMLSSPDVLLALEWYGAGAAYFRFDPAGAESVIRNARLRRSPASLQYTYDIKTLHHPKIDKAS